MMPSLLRQLHDPSTERPNSKCDSTLKGHEFSIIDVRDDRSPVAVCIGRAGLKATRSQKRREICRPLPGTWRIAGSSIAGRVCACYSNDRQLLPLPVKRAVFRSYSGNNGSRQRLFDPAIMAAGNMQLQGPAIWAAGNIN